MEILDTLKHFLIMVNKEVVSIAFDSELDFITRMLTVLVLASFFLQVVYLFSPKFLKKRIQCIDHDSHHTGWSKTAFVAGFFLFMLLLSKIQRFSINSTDKVNESRIEKEFRHRRMFSLDLNSY